MTFRGKKKRKNDDFIDDDDTEEEEESEEEDDEVVNKKKGKKPATKVKASGDAEDGDDDGGFVCELSSKRKVTVKKFRAEVILVDIREYTLGQEESKPTKKGISLTADQWKILRDNAPAVDEAIAAFKKT